MNKKIYTIIGIITIGILVYAGIASTCALKKVSQLEGEVGKVEQKQEEFSNKLEKVTQDMAEEEDEQKPEDTDSIDNEDITKDWKVYRNEEYGYSVKYPKNTDVTKLKSYDSIGFFYNDETFLVIRVTSRCR